MHVGDKHMDDEDIIALARADAAHGDADAQCFLAINYAYGWDGFEHDPHKALELFLLAAAQDHPQALYNLAGLYETGDGVPQDPAEAERLYARAAARGHEDALLELDSPCTEQ